MPDNTRIDHFSYRTVLRFNVVYVLESLAAGEAKTGRDLFDLSIYPGAVQLSGMHAEFATVPDESALLRRLRDIAHAARIANHRPIVHIEAHGGADGIELADGRFTTWRTLVPALAAINQACRNNLLVVAISCQGWNLTASLIPFDRAPVFMLIGPPDSMRADDLLGATRRFYETLVSTTDLNKALEAMNSNADFLDWKLRPATAEILFCRAFRSYVAAEANVDALRRRENEIVAELTRQQHLNVFQSAALRLDVRRDLSDLKSAYDRMRARFDVRCLPGGHRPVRVDV